MSSKLGQLLDIFLAFNFASNSSITNTISNKGEVSKKEIINDEIISNGKKNKNEIENTINASAKKHPHKIFKRIVINRLND